MLLFLSLFRFRAMIDQSIARSLDSDPLTVTGLVESRRGRVVVLCSLCPSLPFAIWLVALIVFVSNSLQLGGVYARTNNVYIYIYASRSGES
jgi:hypothetical protein